MIIVNEVEWFYSTLIFTGALPCIPHTGTAIAAGASMFNMVLCPQVFCKYLDSGPSGTQNGNSSNGNDIY